MAKQRGDAELFAVLKEQISGLDWQLPVFKLPG